MFFNSISTFNFSYLTFTILLIYLILIIKRNKSPLLYAVLFYLNLFFIPRLIILVFIPGIVGKLDNDGSSLLVIEQLGIEKVLMYFSFYSFITIFFINLFQNILNINIQFAKYKTSKYTSILSYFFIIGICIDVILMFFTKIFNFNMIGEEMSNGFLIRLFSNPVLFLFLLSVIVLFSRSLSNSKKFIAYTYLFIHLLTTIIFGSRSGLFTLLVFIFIIIAVSKVEFKLSFKKRFYLFFVIIVLGSVSWVAGSYFRYGSFTVGDNLAEITKIFRRIGGGAESFALVVGINHDFSPLIKFHSWSDSFLKGINLLIPGDIFSTVNFTAGQFYKEVIYQDFSGKFHGDYWSGFGYLYAIYGFPISIIFLFLVVAFFQLAIKFISYSRNYFSFILIVDLIFIFCESFLIQGSSDSIFLNLIPELIYFVPFFLI